MREKGECGQEADEIKQLCLATLGGESQAVCVSETSVTRLLRQRKEVPARSPQVGIISSATSSYLREWVKTGLFNSEVICIARPCL